MKGLTAKNVARFTIRSCWFTIIDRLHDVQNIPIHIGSYKFSVRVESPTTPTLTLYFTVK